MEELAERLTRINQAIKRLGVLFPDPLLTLGTLTGAAIPYLRICEEGLVQIKTGRWPAGTLFRQILFPRR
jgi:adenine deaminase